MKLNIPVCTLPSVILAIISLIVYLCAPSHYIWGFDLYCGIHYVVSLLLFFFFLKKKNYFDFDTIFLIAYFFVFFVYSIFLYPINEAYFVIFTYSFNVDIISKSTALALLGSQMYIMGAVWYHSKQIKRNLASCSKVKLLILPTKIIHYLTISSFLLFLVSGGYSFFKDVYSNGKSLDSGAIYGYILALFAAFIMISIIFEFNKMRRINLEKFEHRHFSKLLLFFIVVSSLIMLSSGTRTIVLQMLLGTAGLYSLLYRPISLKLFFLLLIIGASSMTMISSTRGGDAGLEVNGFADLFMDLIVNNRSTFTAVQYAEDNGLTMGTSMLAYILKIIPFMQGIFFSIFNIDPEISSSAKLLTTDTLGEDSSWGLGTNIIADLYLAFGVFGVIVLMFFLGYIVRKAETQAKMGNIYYMALYTVLISLSVYMVRSEFLFGLSLLVWVLCIVNIIIHFVLKHKYNEEDRYSNSVYIKDRRN